MHAALDGDVGVRDAGCEELAESTEHEGVAWGKRPLSHPSSSRGPPLEQILQLLEDGVLEYRVDDEHEGREHAGKESERAFVFDQGKESGKGGGGFAAHFWGGDVGG